ncbi:MAG: hypothetical protein K2Z81_09165, partial [Cyanobacteria bacterium]|nr:hypothetical protein [Cyanobacteriota bacterium]
MLTTKERTKKSKTDSQPIFKPQGILFSTEQTRLYLRLLDYIRPYWMLFLCGALAAVPSGAMDGLIAFLAGQGLQKILVEGNHKLVYLVPVAVLLVAFFQGLFRFLETFCIRYVGAAAIRDLRCQMFEHLEKQQLLYFLRQSSGVLIGRMVNDVAVIENAISQTFQTMISRVITLIGLSLVLILQSFWLSVIALAILSLIVIPVAVLGKKIRKSARGGQEAIGDLVCVLSESIQGAKVVKSFNLEDYQTKRFRTTNQSFMSNQMRAVRSEAML